MIELATAIPDADTLLALEPEELAGKILFLLRDRHDRRGFHPRNLLRELDRDRLYSGVQNPFYHRWSEVSIALAEAWSWLEAQGLIVPDPRSIGDDSLRQLSRRAARFAGEADFQRYRTAGHLPKEALHPRIAQKVWMAFVRGEYDVAVFQAMKAVEVAVRAATGIPDLGVNLMRRAFKPDSGPLTDMMAEAGEREARSALFAGAIGSYKNPHSHRDVPLDDPAEAVEVILLANHLLRIVDGRCQAMKAAPAQVSDSR